MSEARRHGGALGSTGLGDRDRRTGRRRQEHGGPARGGGARVRAHRQRGHVSRVGVEGGADGRGPAPSRRVGGAGGAHGRPDRADGGRPPRPGGRDRRHRSAPNARDGRGGLAGVDLSGGTRTDGRAAARDGVRGRCGDGRSRHRDRGLSRCGPQVLPGCGPRRAGESSTPGPAARGGEPPTRAPSERRSRGATPATARREIAPLRPAADAIRIDSTALDAEGVVRRMLDEVAALRERDKS